MESREITSRVALNGCESYDENIIYSLMKEQFAALDIGEKKIKGKTVAIKPNLVRKMDSSLAGTTHPSLIYCASKLLLELGAKKVIIAESPGGPYNEAALKGAYRVCGVSDAAERSGAELNYTVSWQKADFEDGVKSKCFNIIDPIADCDVIVNICKLKSHGMAMMSAAVKNYFGTVPGVEKFEMHARFPKMEDFCGMIVDLCEMHYRRKYTVNIVDAVVGMEGNGPTNGSPKKIGALLCSEDPFALDAVCERLISFDGRVQTVHESRKRGLFTDDGIEIIGESLEKLKITDFKLPDSERTPLLTWLSEFADGRLMKFFEPKPAINKNKCRACGECVRSCPQHTIVFSKEKKLPEIKYEKCIKCFCCQELCPHDAVKIKQNLLVKLIH